MRTFTRSHDNHINKIVAFAWLLMFLFFSGNAQDVVLSGSAACGGGAVTGTWAVPCDISSITVEVYGAGGGAGGGGGGSNGGLFNTRGGGGGGGGGYTSITINVVPGSSFTYSIGSGGCGGNGGSDGSGGGNGTAGGNSSFTGLNAGGAAVNLTANGGARGSGGSGTGGSTGSGGGGGSASGGTTNNTGAGGNNGSGGNGGAGGAGAGPSGGAGGASTSNNGSTYGGAGAGGGDSPGGRGATGGILITFVTTVGLPANPIIAFSPPTCAADGSSTISNYDAATTYTFTPTGPSVAAGGLINNMVTGTSYTVVAGAGSCVSGPSAPFSNAASGGPPAVPITSTTPPTCTSDGISTITNYNAAMAYIFTPVGPLAGAGGVITGMIPGTSYRVEADDGSCTSGLGLPFSNSAQLPAPAVPMVSTVAPTCTSDGISTIDNYNATNTYVFTPAGPSAGAGGVVSGMVIGTSYTVEAADASCTSAPSDPPFSNAAQLPSPVVAIDDIGPYCADNTSPIPLTGTPATGGTFSGTGVSGNTFIPSQAAVGSNPITYSYTDPSSTCTATATTAVEIIGLPLVGFSGLSPYYCEDNTSTIPLTGQPAGGTFSGPGVTGADFIPSSVSDGIYEIIYAYTDQTGCSNVSTKSVVIYELPQVTIVDLDQQYCDNAPTVTLEGFPSGGAFTVNGSAATIFDPAVLTPGSSNDVFYTYTNGQGCSSSVTRSVSILASPTATFGALNAAYCSNAPAVPLSGTPTGGEFSGSGITGSDDMFHPSIAAEGVYTLDYTFIDLNGCSFTDTKTVEVLGIPAITDVVITDANCGKSNGSVAVTPSGSSGLTITWSHDNSLSVTELTDLPEGNYDVTVTDNNGCAAFEKIEVRCVEGGFTGKPEIFVPNAFSPNKDGINDVLAVLGDNVVSMQMKIFDRWGQLVFVGGSQAEGWDGTVNSKEANVGVYVYLLDLVYNENNDNVAEQRTGSITLLR